MDTNLLERDYQTNLALLDIEYAIYQEVKASYDEATEQGDPDWTSAIKRRVGLLGQKSGYNIRSTFHNKEWLYDLVWHNESENHLHSLKLVLESELCHRSNNFEGRVGLLWDFEKLLVSTAEIKVMVCCNEGNRDYPNNIVRVRNFFENAFRKFTAPTDIRVLLVIIDDYFSGDVIPHVMDSKDVLRFV